MSILDEIRPEWDALKEAVKDVVALNAELCAEVKRLRHEKQSIGTTAYELGRSSLMAENDKLRELVKHLYECEEHADCEGCKYEADDVCDFQHDMRELGIEV